MISKITYIQLILSTILLFGSHSVDAQATEEDSTSKFHLNFRGGYGFRITPIYPSMRGGARAGIATVPVLYDEHRHLTGGNFQLGGTFIHRPTQAYIGFGSTFRYDHLYFALENITIPNTGGSYSWSYGVESVNGWISDAHFTIGKNFIREGKRIAYFVELNQNYMNNGTTYNQVDVGRGFDSSLLIASSSKDFKFNASSVSFGLVDKISRCGATLRIFHMPKANSPFNLPDAIIIPELTIHYTLKSFALKNKASM